MDTCFGQVAGVMQIPKKGFHRQMLVANFSCDSGIHKDQKWQNVSQGQGNAISMDSELPINPVSHAISQQMPEETAKSSIPEWCHLWPSIGVSSVLLAIGVKIMF
jgi:hypothetical protein